MLFPEKRRPSLRFGGGDEANTTVRAGGAYKAKQNAISPTRGGGSLLSVVVPAYKQERTIKKDIQSIEAFLKTLPLDYEIVVVADGRLDDTFGQALKLKSSTVKVFGYSGKNRGKGYALRYGAARARGELVAFLDAGMEINPQGIRVLWEYLKQYDADILIGSKRHPESKVDYPLVRQITSVGYQVLVRLLFGLRVRDTQTGIKLFKREVLDKVMPRLVVKDYAIDIEILAVARHLGFKKIYEAPVEVYYHFDDLTHSSTLHSIWRMLLDTLAVFYRLKIRHYYEDGSKRKWVYDEELELKINV